MYVMDIILYLLNSIIFNQCRDLSIGEIWQNFGDIWG